MRIADQNVIYTKKNLVLIMTTKKNYNVRDHCHYTGKYRGAAHSICNLRYYTSREISVIAHNAYMIII